MSRFALLEGKDMIKEIFRFFEPLDMKEMLEKILEFRNARDWEQFHNPKDLVAAMAIEVGELQEKFLWKSQEESYDIAKNDPEVVEEVADVLNYLLLFAETSNIDLKDAVLKKIAHNDAKYPVEKARGKSTKYNKL